MRLDDKGVVPLKAFIVVALIGLFLGSWIVVMNTAEFKVEIRIANATVIDTDTIGFDVDVRFTNKQPVDVVINKLVVQVYASDKTTLLFSNINAPIQNVFVGSQQSTIRSVSGQIDNIDVLGTTVFVVVDIDWSQGDGTFTAHHEKLYDVSQFLGQ